MSKLLDYCIGEGRYGIPSPATEYSDKLYRYLRISDISDDGFLLDTDKKSVDSENAFKYLLKEGEIVIARTGNSTGRTLLYEKRYGDLVFAGFLIKYKIDDRKINPKFIKYYTISKIYKKWVKNYQDGSTRGNMNAQSFAEMPVPSIYRSQQDKMVKLLDAITLKIELNNKINAELEKISKTLYDYWFVQFDFPAENNRPYKSSGGAMVYNEELKREIPKGWEVSRLNDVLYLLKDGTHNPPKRVEQGIPLLTGTMFGSNFLQYGEVTYISEKDYLSIHKVYQPKENDIVLTKIGTVGKVNMLTVNDIPLAIHCNSAILRPNKKCLSLVLFFLLKSGEFQGHLKKSMSKTIQEFINLEKLSNLQILIIPISVQKLFEKKVHSIYSKMCNIREENQYLIRIRDFLLPMLMNGQVKVI